MSAVGTPSWRLRCEVAALCALCLTPLSAVPATVAEALPVYEQRARSADGIGKRYMGREIAQVMGWQGAVWLEREEREREERTDQIGRAHV